MTRAAARLIRAVAVAVAACALLAGLRADAAPAPSDTVRRALEKAATLLAKAGRKGEVKETLGHLGDLGADPAAVAKLRDACEKTLAKATKTAPAVPEAAKALRAVAAELAAGLPALEAGERFVLARRILAIDGTNADAHRAAGHVQHAGKWTAAEVPPCLAARAELAAAAAAARRLPVEFETGESPLDSIAQVTGTKGTYVRAHGVSLHSSRLSRAKLERILGHVLRALALSEAARERETAIPTFPHEVQFVLYSAPPDYRKAIDEARGAGGLGEAEAARARRMSGFQDARGPMVGWSYSESGWEAGLFFDLWVLLTEAQYGRRVQPCLAAGHMNWVLLQFVGQGLPPIAWVEEKTVPGDARRTSDRALEDERIELLHLAKHSLTGARAYLQWLARRAEDPAWSRAIVEQIGEIVGNDLTKATFVAEYLQETRRLDRLCAATGPAPRVAQTFEAALESSLGDFEHRWREWFLPLQPGLAERVDAPPPSEASPAERRFLAYLDKLRGAAIYHRDRELVVPLRSEDELSAACRLHALYLGRHPEQLRAWPDAHEEYPDRADFTAEGCRAGLSSVIAPGVASAEEAIDGWMATFYHRLPLLEPGLARVGFALEGGVAVLDVGSMVAPPEIGTFCTWPPPGGKDVPRRFAPELPNPVPGADQSAWGYPVTVQLFSWTDAPKDLRVVLATGGRPVDCIVSTPDAPSNPDHAPDGAWCLIPKAHLLPATTYTVTVDGMPQIGRVEWTFTTGK